MKNEKLIKLVNTQIPKGYVTPKAAYELTEDAKDVLAELLYTKKAAWAKEARNLAEIGAYTRLVSYLESQVWSDTVKYALKAARILVAVDSQQPQRPARPKILVWRG